MIRDVNTVNNFLQISNCSKLTESGLIKRLSISLSFQQTCALFLGMLSITSHQLKAFLTFCSQCYRHPFFSRFRSMLFITFRAAGCSGRPR